MKELINRTKIKVRFSEVDSMAVVWHGNYVKYLEDGREAFGKEFGLTYLDVYANGFMTPVVKVELTYLKTVKYGDELVIETKLLPTEAAKVTFEYQIFNKKDDSLVLRASTTQVFMNLNGEMELTNPQFYLDWKQKVGILK